MLIFMGVLLIKAVVIFAIVRSTSNKSDSVKTAIALSQIGEFSFALFALASHHELLSDELSNLLILVTVISMIATPFIINNIYKLASYFVIEFYESDKITPIDKNNHIVLCGYSTLGRIIANRLHKENKSFVIISDDLRHVLLARKKGYMAYFGHLEKVPVLESLKVDESSSVIITLSNLTKKLLICEAVSRFKADANLIVKVDSLEEKKALRNLPIKNFVMAQHEVANLLIERCE